MVRQGVTGTEWCIQMSLMICFDLPVPENCDFVVDAVVVTSPYAWSALKHP